MAQCRVAIRELGRFSRLFASCLTRGTPQLFPRQKVYDATSGAGGDRTNDAIPLGVWRQGQGPVDPTREQEAAGRATAAAISLHVAKAKLASLPKPKQLDKRIAGLEQQ